MNAHVVLSLAAGAGLVLPSAAQNVKLNGPLVEVEVGNVVRNRTAVDGTRGMFTADVGSPGGRQLFAYDLEDPSPPLRIAAGGLVDFEMTADGGRAFYSSPGPGASARLFTVGRTGGTPTRLSAPLPSFGRLQGFHLSPDEAWVVYRAEAEERHRFELFLVPSDGSAPARKLSGALVAGGSVSEFVFHPDSGAVLYLADQEQDDVIELFAAGLAGQPPVKLNGSLVAGGDVQSFQLSPDGRFLAYLADQLVDGVQELFALELGPSPAAPQRINATLVAGGSVFSFAWASAGQRIVYLATQDSPSAPELYVRSFPSGVRKLSGSLGLPVGDFRVTPGGELVVYSRLSAAGTAELASVPSRGRQVPRPLHPGIPGQVVSYGLTPDGARVVVRLEENGIETTWSVPSDASAAPVLLAHQGSYGISPDSRTLVHADGTSVRAVPIDGSAPARVLHDLAGTTSVAHNVIHVTDTLALFDEQRPPIDGGFYDSVLMLAPLDGSSPARQVSRYPTQPAGDVRAFELDPTGTRVAYLADQDERGHVDLYLTGTRGAAIPRRVNDPLTMRPVLTTRFRDDGGRLAFVARSGAEALLASAPGDGSAPAVTHDRGSFDRYLWTPDGTRLVYRRTDANGTAELLSLPGDGSGTPRVLNAPLVPGGTVAAEGPGFLIGEKDFQLSSDSRWAVYVASQDQADRFELYRVPADASGAPVVLSGALLPDEDVSRFRLAADASRVVFSVQSSSTGISRILSSPLNGTPAPTQIFVSPSLADFALDSTGQWVVVREAAGSLQLHAVPIGGGPLFPLSPFGERVLRFEIPAGSSRLVFQTEQRVRPRRVEVFSARLDGAGSPVLLSPAPYGQVELEQQAFALSPDGVHVALPAAGGLLHVRIADGGSSLLDPANLAGVAIPSDRLRFSDDGARLVYPREVDGKLRLYWVAADGSGAPRVANGPLVQGGDVQLAGDPPFAFAPGGERVLYLADQEQDQVFELFATTLTGPRASPR